MKTQLKSYLLLALLLTPTLALADTTLDDVLQNGLTYITGLPARILATFAIVGVGFMTFKMNKIPKHEGVAIMVGIGFIFGAATLLNILIGES